MADPFRNLNTIEEVERLYSQYHAAGQGRLHLANSIERKLEIHRDEGMYHISLIYFTTTINDHNVFCINITFSKLLNFNPLYIYICYS